MAEVTWTYEKISSSHMYFLRLAALIPFEGQTFNYIGTKLLSTFCHVMNIIFNTMFSSYGVRRILARESIEVDYISDMMIVEGECFRYLLLCFKRDELVKLLLLCKELWYYMSAEEGRTIREFERKAHYFRTFILINGLLVVTLFLATAQFVRLPPETANGTERRILPFRFYVDEIQEEPAYTLVTILQAVVTYTIPVIIAGIDTIGLFLIMMACGYLRSVQNRLLSLTELSKGDHNEIVLSCVHLHQKIMVYCEEIERFTRGIFLITIFTTIYNMSITGIKLLENDENMIKYMSILTLNLFQFFTCQWSPEYLLTESEAIGNAAYFASLEQSSYDDKTNRILLFMMLRAQRPIQLTAGGYINLSMETFGAMIKSAFSFFAVLRSFNG